MSEQKEPTFEELLKLIKSPKQKKFVKEYLIDLNGTQAAIRASYSKKTAEQIAYQLLQKTSVRKAVDAGMKKRAEELGIDAKWVIDNLIEVSEKCMGKRKIKIYNGIINKEVEVTTFNQAGANKALELIGKHVGMFKSDIGELLEEGGFNLNISVYKEGAKKSANSQNEK